jgi:hypothetical protein
MIDARKAFAIPGHPSLFEYCIKELGYSEGSACRRIQAMKLIREIPEYGKKLEDGAVGEKRTPKEKIDLLKKIEGLSSKKAEKVFATELPELAKPDKKTPINERQLAAIQAYGLPKMQKFWLP